MVRFMPPWERIARPCATSSAADRLTRLVSVAKASAAASAEVSSSWVEPMARCRARSRKGDGGGMPWHVSCHSSYLDRCVAPR